MAKYANRIDSLIMLEAAVADNAITGNYTREKNPLAMELFPFAHKSVKSIRIMYSQEDGVLGADNRALDLDDGISDATRGSYPLKYSVLANRNNAIADYYPYANHPPIAACHSKKWQENAQPYECINLQASYLGRKIKQEIRTLLEQEAEKTMKASGIPELTYLKPWSHYRRFEKGSVYFEHIVEVLTETLFDNWNVRDSTVRQALGHQGSQQTIEGIGQNGEKLTVKWAKDLFADSFIQEVDEITKRYYPNRQRYHLERMASVCSIIGLNFEQDLKLDLIVKKIKTSNTSTPLVKIRDYLRFEVLQKDYDEAGNQYNNWSLRGVRQGMLAMTHHVPDFNTEWKPYNPDENRWRIYVNTVRNGGKLK